MNNDSNQDRNFDSSDKIVYNTGISTYKFTKSWVENDALKDLLVDLIADDYKQQQFRM